MSDRTPVTQQELLLRQLAQLDPGQLPAKKIQRTERGVASALRGAERRWKENGAGAIGATR